MTGPVQFFTVSTASVCDEALMKRIALLIAVLAGLSVSACEDGGPSDECVPEPMCTPECPEGYCGDDGCGCPCPACPAGLKCRDQQCVCGICGGDCGECPEIEWISVEQGTFSMGCKADAANVDKICGTPDVLPPHDVSVPAFEIARFETTAALYAQCVATGACLASNTLGSSATGNNPNLRDHPINHVKWFDAEAFCMWIGGRLGSEAEWEYAARGTDGRYYPWGFAGPTCRTAWTGVDGCSINMTHPVGTMPGGKSPWGVDDMAGNVAEWVADHCHTEGYQGAPADGSAWTKEGGGLCRVFRGGGFGAGLEEARSFNREFMSGDLTFKDVGIRCFR